VGGEWEYFQGLPHFLYFEAVASLVIPGQQGFEFVEVEMRVGVLGSFLEHLLYTDALDADGVEDLDLHGGGLGELVVGWEEH
jgi:hypothetical protein